MENNQYETLQAAAAYRDFGGVEAEKQTEDNKQAAIPLSRLGFVYADANGALFITEKGIAALAEETKAREQAARQEERDQAKEEQENVRESKAARRSWTQVWVQILANLLVFILGIVVEHYGGVLTALLKLFQK